MVKLIITHKNGGYNEYKMTREKAQECIDRLNAGESLQFSNSLFVYDIFPDQVGKIEIVELKAEGHRDDRNT